MSLMYCASNSNGSGWLVSFIYVYQNMLAMFSPWCQQYPKLHCDSSSTASKCCGQHKMYHPYETNQTILKYECILKKNQYPCIGPKTFIIDLLVVTKSEKT